MKTQPMTSGTPKTPEESKFNKKPRTPLALQALVAVILGIVIQFATFNAALVFELILFVAGIVLAITAIRKITKTGERGKVMAIISLVLGLLGLFNVVSGFVVNRKISEMEQSGAEQKLDQVWSAVKTYKNDNNNECPANLAQLYPKYLSSTDILYDAKGKEWIIYKVSTDKKACDASYGASFGVGM